MLIIKILAEENGQHHFESQSHRTECWMDGFIAVPPELEGTVFECMGFCDIELNEDGTEIINITALEVPDPEPEPIPDPEPVEPDPEPSVWDELDAAYQEGVNDV
jgi:hypothetical protein